ncbi:MAG: divergent PAP2 family protein [Oscillospiraceae bacterium]|nr:divergent PAP2 family protein [Oscillospiraceae bacterium]
MDLFYNAPLTAALTSWVVAQLIKNLGYIIRYRKVSIERFLGAGGMPSSHSAAVCALAAALGRMDGLASTTFALALILALVVMYDASGVRRAAGMHAREINRIKLIINKLDEELQKPEEKTPEAKTKEHKAKKQKLEKRMEHLKEFLGHSPAEVFFGAMIGIGIGIIVVTPVL